MNKNVIVQLSLLSGIIILTGCGQAEKPQENYGYRIQGDTVMILDQNWAKHIHVVDVKTESYAKTIVTAGTVRPIPTQLANIASPFAGRVLRSFVHIGQFVNKGTPLFEIHCPDFTSAQKEYFQAQSSMELALKDLKRKEDLNRNGVSSQKELEEAQNSLLIADKEFENAQAALAVYEVKDLKNMRLGQPLVVKSPINGEVIENNIVNGQYLKDDSDPIAVVANLDSIWISAQVKEKDIRFISEGSVLNVDVAAWPNLKLQGTIYHIEEAVDDNTRSIQILSVCENKNEALKLGMYTTVHFLGIPQQMIAIPETALLQGQDNNYVFVQTAPNKFVRRIVKVEATINHTALIEQGLYPSEKIIGEGGYYLKL